MQLNGPATAERCDEGSVRAAFFTLTLAIGYYVIASSNLEAEDKNIRA
jgi:hypothetical protein